MDVYLNSQLETWVVSKLLNRDESLEKKEEKRLITVEQKLNDLYEAIFVTEYENRANGVIMGKCEFDERSRLFVKMIESQLSPYADYEVE